ncbi:MAG: hypothetical protein EKK40_05080 [Bradyrhizobiaceae bacterium]|nr:MAG: hypothetical protein EKK40_05080 [Bradyrhizobiaceae bacterium]
MLRYRILVSAFPLLVIGALAGTNLIPSAQPCIARRDAAFRIAYAPWQGQQHVAFTTDPKRATVRVQVVDSPELADFSVIDDIETLDTTSCESSGQVHYIAIDAYPSALEPVIYVSTEPGDYRVFVRSKAFSVREAAALLVGASPRFKQAAAASL